MMKKIIFVLSVLSLVAVNGIFMNAYSQCTPDFTMTEAGIEPDQDSLECIVQGAATDVTIFFKNFSSVTVGGNPITVNWLRIDSVKNIPCGLAYAVDQVDRTYDSGEVGCIKVQGVTGDAVGQYKLGIWVTINIQGLGELSGEAGQLSQSVGSDIDFSYHVRVVASAGAACPSVDTSSAANNLASTCESVDFTSINVVKENIEDLNISPNPFSGQTEITFYSVKSGNYFAKLYDVVGKEVYSEAIQVVSGSNTFRLNRGNLSKGVYMYTITDGKNNISKRIVSY